MQKKKARKFLLEHKSCWKIKIKSFSYPANWQFWTVAY